MGMFDTTFVSHKLLDPVIAAAGADIQLEKVDGYYSFQTKDLENCLTNFYIKEDGTFCWEKQEYGYQKPGDEHIWNPTDPTGEPEYVVDTRTAYINFYDFYYTHQERIFVTFTAHVKQGKLAEPITIQSIERTDLEEESIKHKQAREEWKKVTSAWEWRLAQIITNAKFKLFKILYPLTSQLDRFLSYLRERAKQKATSSL